MGNQSTWTVNFGSHPGDSVASSVVTTETGILSTSLVEAWLWPVATSSHSVDEHLMAKGDLEVSACSIVAGTGFTIVITVPDRRFNEDAPARQGSRNLTQTNRDTLTTWGEWTVAYVWN